MGVGIEGIFLPERKYALTWVLQGYGHTVFMLLCQDRLCRLCGGVRPGKTAPRRREEGEVLF